MASNTEQPKYQTLEKNGNIEIRRYQPMIMAVTYSSRGGGFQQLAGYIFGGNESNQKIAMTAPVANQATDEGWQTAFMMPSQYQLTDLPEPESDNIQFIEVPARTMAVIVFPGWVNRSSVNKNRQALQDYLQEQGIETEGEPIINQYNDPWTPAARRTNEIQLQLSGEAHWAPASTDARQETAAAM
ncbi:hypothetical protein BST96_15435 [Oceanicoccus sagamiensis]|uniref:Heme-binding protein n=2 Tax=Oceanicoccus sagamiensis TaxID=716816 RepID=A0A1X9NG51_9GAMM|nr:hypothetical protein BST96_15435 [Oceanicoccus sagamiensis]